MVHHRNPLDAVLLRDGTDTGIAPGGEIEDVFDAAFPPLCPGNVIIGIVDSVKLNICEQCTVKGCGRSRACA